VYVLAKGVVVAPTSARWTGPWLGATRATSLQRVANRPIICHVLDALCEAGVAEAAVVAGPDVAAEITECVASEGPRDVPIRDLVQDPGDGEEALLAVIEFVGDAPCILHRADSLLGQPILSITERPGEQAVDAVLLVQPDPPTAKRLRLVGLDQLTDSSAHSPFGNAGACVLGPGVLRRLGRPARSAELLDFAAVAARIANAGGSAHVQVARGLRLFAGDALELLDMNRAVLDTLVSEAVASASDGNRFEGHIAIHPTARVTSSIVIGPVVVGPEALISDSYIGPHTSIGERVRIEGAEIERSIVLAEASLLHLGSRLVASIVGREARIFRDFSMPRALRLQVGDGDQVALC
jgi:glucose-1-phosphate thymidylyltransferase